MIKNKWYWIGLVTIVLLNAVICDEALRLPGWFKCLTVVPVTVIYCVTYLKFGGYFK